MLVPHGGELLGPGHVATCLTHLNPTRLGHGVRSIEDSEVLARLIDAGVALEVCPASNVSLGVYSTIEEVPVRELVKAGADVALGADDPLLFGSRLGGQYALLRAAQELTDAELADLARVSIRRSAAPDALKASALAGIDAWMAEPVSDERRV